MPVRIFQIVSRCSSSQFLQTIKLPHGISPGLNAVIIELAILQSITIENGVTDID